MYSAPDAAWIVRHLGQIVLLALSLAAGAHAQTHHYEVVYRGAFSLGADMPIAALSMANEQDNDGIRLTRLSATSAPFPVVESLYPIRYRFRSWAHPGDGQLLAFETYEKTRREKHRLYLRDDSTLGTRKLDRKSGEGDSEAARLEAGVAPAVDLSAPLFDRLGLLQQLRREALKTGLELRLPVTNGRERLVYRVRVESAPVLRLNGRPVPSWKLRLDAFERDAAGRESPAHRSAFVWLSRDPARIPLRAEVRHAIGLFSVRLVSAEPGGSPAKLAQH